MNIIFDGRNQYDPDAVFLVLPADHVIDNPPAGGGCGH